MNKDAWGGIILSLLLISPLIYEGVKFVWRKVKR
jgi:hypothetical protein